MRIPFFVFIYFGILANVYSEIDYDSLINHIAKQSSNLYSLKAIHSSTTLKNDNNSLGYFTVKHKDLLNKTIALDELMAFKKDKTQDYENVFLRHWRFKEEKDAKIIEGELKRKYDGEGPPIKEPNIVVRVGKDLYVIYVRMEGFRTRLSYFKKILALS